MASKKSKRITRDSIKQSASKPKSSAKPNKRGRKPKQTVSKSSKQTRKPNKPTEKPVKRQAGVDLTAQLEALQNQIATLQSRLEKAEKATVEAKDMLNSGRTIADEEQYLTKKDRMKKKLKAQPKVNIIVPLEGSEVRGQTSLPVTLNGYRLNVPKGVYIEVPQQIGKVIMDHLNQTEEALDNKYRLKSGTPLEKLEALS